jgi:DNA-binding beta-propeller fold protein YncE
MFQKLAILTLCLLLVGGAALLAPSADSAPLPKYQAVADWPQLPEGAGLGPVAAVATNADAQVLIFHRGKQPIMLFDREGKFLRGWGDDLVMTAHGLRVDHDGNIWITDIGHHLVTKFNAEGKVLLTLGKKDKPGDGPDQFNKPTDVAVASNGDIYVSDGYGNSRIVKFTREGKYLKEWGKKGTGPGEFNIPHVIVLDAKGQVYVGDRENNRVQVFDADGKFLAQWPESGAPYGLFLNGERVLVADGRANAVKVLDRQGKPLGRFGEKGSRRGQLDAPHWICADTKGAVYVAETGGKRVQKFVER